jgi:hypothetical protein
MPWYVSWAPTPWNGRLGVFIASPTLLAVGQKATAFCRRAQRTVRCTPDKHYSLSGALPRQPTIEVCSSRPLDPTVTQTVRCTPDSLVLQPESPFGPLCVDCLGVPSDSSVHTGQVLFNVRCTTGALPACPLHGFLRWFFGLLLFLSLGLLSSFYVFFWGVASSVS